MFLFKYILGCMLIISHQIRFRQLTHCCFPEEDLFKMYKYFYFLIFFYGNKDCKYNLTELKILNLIIKIKIINEP